MLGKYRSGKGEGDFADEYTCVLWKKGITDRGVYQKLAIGEADAHVRVFVQNKGQPRKKPST
jgi:hypothetical protein